MTSDDTHSRTLELLESNSYFGMEPTQVKLLKQVHNDNGHCCIVEGISLLILYEFS